MKLVPRGEFSRNVLTLMGGTIIAQALPVAISPILTRLYAPEDFGVLALFVALTTIFGVIANGRYELAIMLPESDEDALSIAALGMVIAISISSILLLIVVFFGERIAQVLDNEEIRFWLYFLPISVLMTGVFNVLNYFNTRMKKYKDIASANIWKSLTLAVVQVGVGLVKSGASGLIVGQLLSLFGANGRLFKNSVSNVNVKNTLSFSGVKTQAKRYIDFPKYSLWSALANSLSVNLVNILISLIYSVATLGHYSLVQRVLSVPSSLIGGAIGQVFFQQSAEEKRKTGMAIKTFDATVKKLTLLSLPAFIFIYFVVEDVFAFAFGEEWRVAGKYAQYIVPLFAIRFVASAVSNLNNVFEKQRVALAWQLGLLVLSLLVMYFSHVFNIKFEAFLLIFNWILFIYYALLLVVLFFISRGRL